MLLEKVILDLYELNMIKFGDFTLKSGKSSNIYIDLRLSISHPKIYQNICNLIYSQMAGLKYDFICGVPYSAITFASSIAYTHSIPMLLKRKDAKNYGTKKIIEGDFKQDQTCLLIEDTVTTGSSILETIEAFKTHGITIKDCICFIDRDQGAHQTLTQHECQLHSVLQLDKIIEVLSKHNKITPKQKLTLEKR